MRMVRVTSGEHLPASCVRRYLQTPGEACMWAKQTEFMPSPETETSFAKARESIRRTEVEQPMNNLSPPQNPPFIQAGECVRQGLS